MRKNRHKNLSQPITAWSWDIEGHAETCVERYCELARKNASTLKPAETPCTDDHQLPLEESYRRIGTNLCSERILLSVSVLGQNWDTCCTSDGQHAGTLNHQVEQCFWQNTGTIGKLPESNETLQTILFCCSQISDVQTVHR